MYGKNTFYSWESDAKNQFRYPHSIWNGTSRIIIYEKEEKKNEYVARSAFRTFVSFLSIYRPKGLPSAHIRFKAPLRHTTNHKCMSYWKWQKIKRLQRSKIAYVYTDTYFHFWDLPLIQSMTKIRYGWIRFYKWGTMFWEIRQFCRFLRILRSNIKRNARILKRRIFLIDLYAFLVNKWNLGFEVD
jgi:hypothetical protein